MIIIRLHNYISVMVHHCSFLRLQDFIHHDTGSCVQQRLTAANEWKEDGGASRDDT
jgi:hypothetical protein